MDYKTTLNLPRTDFPMKADLVSREPERLERWQQQRLYARIMEVRQGGPKFVLHDGPPFANGDVHIGTALNKTLKDILIRYKSLRGYCAPYVPGWDCHGLPIEFKVIQELRKAGQATTDPASIRRECEAYARKYIQIQKQQFKRLGVLGDWEQPYLTLDKEYEADELRLFADLVEQGFIYRGKKPVYWSIPCRTALAEAEVEYQDHLSPSIYVKFPVLDHPGTHLLIWTTTPWTLPANLAVAYNSAFTYSVVQVGAELYILETMLVGTVAEKCKWENYQIVRTLYPEHLQELVYQHPFCQRTGRLYAGDDFVDNQTGTGFVHIAPGHGMEDYLLGLREGLPIYSPVNDDGCFAHTTDLPPDQQMPAELLGKSILEKHGKSDANEAVLHLLRQHKLLVHQEKYHHSYPHCWRSKTPIIFRAMDQWFIRVDHQGFRQRALAEIDRVQWVPAWGVNRIKGAVEARPDWCISRQRAWGVPLPAFYDAEGRPILDARIVRAAARLIEKHGSQVWFETKAEDLWKLLRPDDWSGAEAATKSMDTLDVWIDSGSSSRAVLMRRQELRHNKNGTSPEDWQADVYLEGSDQHRGWFQSSLLLSLAAHGAAPFKTVLTHGFMVDADREKISKSKQGQGGYIKPQTSEQYINDHGADVVRLWVSSQDYRNDIVVSDERIRKVGETYRVIRNALRYQLSNLYDFDPAQHSVPVDQLTGLDLWILDELAGLEREVMAAYEEYEFHTVYQKLSQFAAVQLSAVYHDLVKDRLYTDPANSPRRRSTQTTLHRLVTSLCQMLSPILVFTADEAWEFIPGRGDESVHLTQWQPQGVSLSNEQRTLWQRLFEVRELALIELEKARQSKLIGKSLEAQITLTLPSDAYAMMAPLREDLRELLNVSQLQVYEGLQTAIHVTKAAGEKCERCWHWETDVGSHPEHPTLCRRCLAAI